LKENYRETGAWNVPSQNKRKKIKYKGTRSSSFLNPIRMYLGVAAITSLTVHITRFGTDADKGLSS
jgi:hypothetical protein